MVRCLKRNKRDCIVVDTADDCIDKMSLRVVLNCGIEVKDIENPDVNYEYLPINKEYYILYSVKEVKTWQYMLSFEIHHKESDDIVFQDDIICQEFPVLHLDGYTIDVEYYAVTYQVEGGKSLHHRYFFNDKLMYQKEEEDIGFKTGFKE